MHRLSQPKLKFAVAPPPKAAPKPAPLARVKRRPTPGLHLPKVVATAVLMTIAASFALQAAAIFSATRVAPRLETATVLPPSPQPAVPEIRLAAFALPKLEKLDVPVSPPIDPVEERRSGLRHKIHFQAHTPEICLPPSLMGVIYDLAEIYGEVTILSTYRDPKRNARVGGVGKSFHLECRAIDFKVAGKAKDIIELLRNRPEVGGYKRYSLGFYHIDDGPKRSW